MTAAASPAVAQQFDKRVGAAVREGLASRPKRLPAWLFYDEAGSRLFDAITELPEYYLTCTERGILASNAAEMIAKAAGESRVRIVELGAGSADKTRLVLKAATELQSAVLYEPVDVSASALECARERIEREIAGVTVMPRVMDYTHGDGGRLHLGPVDCRERRMVLYIGSSIGNFEPHQAANLLRRARAGLRTGDSFLLGVDLIKDESTLLAAYDDAAGVTAAFNRNLLVRLNRELDAEFDQEAFAHRAVWNGAASRIEMHLMSRGQQRVRVGALDLKVDFAAGESIHTENSYKYRPGQAEALLSEAGFRAEATWSDPRGWFAVCLGRAHSDRM
ncbi:MAG: L-histidine N(alpha)-methyltransferase [Terracidiphilus sp.]|jgi:dimethylhistidine N-methyltransferase